MSCHCNHDVLVYVCVCRLDSIEELLGNFGVSSLTVDHVAKILGLSMCIN